jgi:hypothetical protein
VKYKRETYNYIKEVGEIQTINLPNRRMWGVVFVIFTSLEKCLLINLNKFKI